MEYKELGNTGLHISKISLGTMNFGSKVDKETSKAILDTAFDLGINLFDTSNGYTQGKSESFIGNWLKTTKNRDEILLSSKFGWPTSKSINDRGNSRKNIFRAFSASTNRLQTNYIDLYSAHDMNGFHREVNVKEILFTLNNLVNQEKVYYIGSFVIASWKLVESMWVAEKNGLLPFQYLLTPYSLTNRGAYDLDFKNFCVSYNFPVIGFGPFGGGFTTGKYTRETKFEDTMMGNFIKEYMATENGWKLLDEMKIIANDMGISLAQLSTRWILEKDIFPTIITGVSNKEQLLDLENVLNISIPNNVVERLNELSNPFVRRVVEIN